MLDINAEAAIFLANILGCDILPDRCPDCRALLVMVPAQQVPFCVVCTAKRVKAAQDKQLLLRCKMAASGIVIAEQSDLLAAAL